MSSQFTLPPDTRQVGQGNPPGDMNAVVDCVTAMGAGSNVLNAAYAGGADPTGTSDSAAAFQAAINALPAGGGYLVVPPGTYKGTSGVTSTKVPTWIVCPGGQWATQYNFTGTGDAFRIYDTSGNYRPGGGGIIGLTIDGTSAGAGSSGIHMGDLYNFAFDVGVQNFTGAGSKGVWLDNQYLFAEQVHGRIWVHSCATGVVFDNSANPGGAATGSFDRAILDLMFDQKGAGNLVVFQNGAFVIDGRLGIYGNTDYGSSTFYVLTLTGQPGFSFTATNASPCVFTAAGSYYSNGTAVTLSGSPPTGFTAGTTYFVVAASGATFELAATSGGTPINSSSTGSGTVQGPFSVIRSSVLNIGVECNAQSGTQPGTINFASIAKNVITGCTGVMDFSANNSFAHASNFTGSFQFQGPVFGDSALDSVQNLTQRFSNGSLSSNGTITTRWVGLTTVNTTSALTGMIMQTPVIPQAGISQTVTVVNQGTGSITFDVSGTSHVADGTSDVIAANTAAIYVWSTDQSLWFRCQ